MKKTIFIVFVFFIGIGMVFSQSVNVNKPAQGVTWYKGYTKTITWTSPGCSSPNIIINIFKNSISVANFLEQLTGPNSGSKSWTIPANYSNGDYVLRIKTAPAEDGCIGDSETFTISEKPEFVTMIKKDITAIVIKPPDLEIKIIPIPASPDIYQKTLVEFRVKNIGQGSSKATKMKVFMGTSNTDTWDVKPLDPGRFMYKTKSITPGGVGYIMWSANVDENNNIGDKNRANNYTKYKMIVKGPDLKITNVNTPDYKKTIQQKCTMNVTVTNIGHTKSGKFEIDCDMDTCPLIAQGRKFRVHPGLAPGQSATFQFTHRYACFKMVGVDFYVDKNNQVKEENENNNECGLPFHISGDNIGKKKTPWSSNCN